MTDNFFISSYLIFAIFLIVLTIFFIWRLRQANFLLKAHIPIFAKCAIFWAVIVAFVCVAFSLLAIDFDLIFSDMNKDGTLTKAALNLNQELIIPVPLAAIFGAAFGALFSARHFNFATTIIKRSLVGAGLGLFIFICICLILFLNSNGTSNDSFGRGLLMYFAMLSFGLVPLFACFAFITPATILKK